MTERELRFRASERTGEVSALLLRPDTASALVVLAHGAGAGMRHPFLERVTRELAGRHVGTFRYQFPYMERGSRRPDPRPVLLDTVRAAVSAAREAAPDLPLVAGGKSMGGRMTSLAASEEPLDAVRGLVFLGFPLHPPAKPSADRAEHLTRVRLPLLFVQGTRDSLAPLDAMRPLCADLGDRARLHVVEGGDHSFAVLKRSGRTADDVFQEIGVLTEGWIASVVGTSSCEPGPSVRGGPTGSL